MKAEAIVITDNVNLKNYSLLLLCLLAALVLFYPVSTFEYLDYDDQLYIVDDLATKQLSLANLKTILLEPYATSWYPLSRLSHTLEYVLIGDTAAVTHLVNLLFHFLNAALLFHILLRVGGLAYPAMHSSAPIRNAAIFASVLFVVHPQHVEAVAWAVQRKELLATFFALISIAMYLRQRLFAAGVFLTLAMLSKASVIVLPVFFVLLDVALNESRDTRIKRLFWAVWTNRWFFILSLVVAAITLMHHQAGGALFYEEFPPLTKLMLYSDNSLHGLYRFFTLQPELFHLPISEYVIDNSWLGLAFLALTVILLSATTILIFRVDRQWRIGTMGILFYFTALLPVGGLIVFGNYAFGDRYLYFSSIGIFILVFICSCELFNKFSEKSAQRMLIFVLGSVVVAAFLQSYRVLPKWASTETIWMYDVERRPDSVFANYLLGQQHFFNGERELAYSYFEATIDSDSNRFRVGPRTASALFMAEMMCDAGRSEQALGVLERIPDFGGNMKDIEMLIESLRYSERDSCALIISGWYESTRQ